MVRKRVQQAPMFHPKDLVEGPDFLNRKGELKTLRQRLEHRMNTLLLAPRRFGKTCLIKETFRRSQTKALTIYVDLYSTTNEREMAERIMAALYEATATKYRRFVDWVQAHVTDLNLEVTHQSTGISVRISGKRRPGEDLEGALRSIGRTADRQQRRVFVALDEFQRVMEWDGRDQILAAMRGVIQTQPDVSYVISGSKKHVLLAIVDNPESPFWRQLDVMEIAGIPIAEFAERARECFTARGFEIDDTALDRITYWCGTNPARIQEVLQAMLVEDTLPTSERVDRVVMDLIEGNEHMMRSFIDLFRSQQQVRLLRALAKEDEAEVRPFGEGFVSKHRLGSASAVQKAVVALTDQGILDAEHRFTDPFLKIHLARLP